MLKPIRGRFRPTTEKKILGHFTTPQDELFELTLTKITSPEKGVHYELEVKDWGDYLLIPYQDLDEVTVAFMTRVNSQLAYLANQ